MNDTVQNPAPLLVDIPALLKLLSVGKSKFYELQSIGAFGPEPLQVFGRKKLYRAEDIRRWVRDGCPNREKFLSAKGGT